MTGSSWIDAESAFTRAARARRLAAMASVLRRDPPVCRRLAVYDERSSHGCRAIGERGIREIPLADIRATLEPKRAALFDGCFRPAGATRARWQRLWLAAHRGAALPPISVVPMGEGYAVSDGHHRVSVARARGALTIDAVVEAG